MADYFIPNASEFWARFAPSLGNQPSSPSSSPTPFLDDGTVPTHEFALNNDNNNSNNNDNRPMSKRKDGVRFEGGLFNDDGSIRTGLNRLLYHSTLLYYLTAAPSSTLRLNTPTQPVNISDQYTLSS